MAKAKELIGAKGAAAVEASDAAAKGTGEKTKENVIDLASDAAIEAAAAVAQPDSKDTDAAAPAPPVAVVEPHQKRSTATRIDEVLELIFL